jgi:F-box-like
MNPLTSQPSVYTMSLTLLPPESLVNIASFLPPQCALNMLLTCRRIKDVSDHPTVWRKIVLLNSGIPSEIAEALALGRDSWKRYAWATAQANKENGPLQVSTGVLRWLPQLLVLRRKYRITLIYALLLILNKI